MFDNIYFHKDYNFTKLINDRSYFLKRSKTKFLKNISINIVGGYTFNETAEWMSFFLKSKKLNAKIVNNTWGSAFVGINNFKFNKKNNSFCLIINSWRDIFANNDFSKEKISIDNILKIYENFLSKNQNKNLNILISTFDYPEIKLIIRNNSLYSHIDEINFKLNKLTNKFNNCKIIDLQKEIRSCNIEYYSSRDWYSFGKIFSFEASIIAGYKISKEISSFYFSAKKLLIVDLDNTLWGGVIGDDGLSGIKIGDENSEGRVFSDIQSYIKMLKSKGVLLAIVSKNEENLALEGLKSKKNILKPEDFAIYKINWNSKYENIISIKKELNIGFESIVFLDDSPSERLEVKNFLPQISVPEIGDHPEEYIKILNDYDFFNLKNNLSKEDKKRTSLYKQNKNREIFKKDFKTKGNFIKSLKTKVKFLDLNQNNIDRVHQLTNKTNQFNFSTIRMDVNEIKKYKNKNKRILVIEAEDIFGDYGIISVVYISLKKTYNIDNWLMSCRVFGKTIEQAIFSKIIKDCKKNKRRIVTINYKRTKKNKILTDAMKSLNLIKRDTFSPNWSYDIKLNKSSPKHYCKQING